MGTRGFRLGKVAGFEISFDWSWLIIFFLVIYSLSKFYFPHTYPGLGIADRWVMGTVAAILLFCSVLAHELMHSVVARRYGIDIKGITLFIFGGVSQIKGEPETPKVEFNMAIAGPLTSFAIAGIFYVITQAGASAKWPVSVLGITGYLAFINLALGVFNLIPGFPLDGGRVLRSALWAGFRNLESATRYASYAGQGFGYLLMGFGLFDILGGGFFNGIWFGLIGWFLAGAARSSYEQLIVREALSGIEVQRVMTSDTPSVASDVLIDDFVENYLMSHNYTCYPVVDGDQVKGIVGIDDIRALPRTKWANTTVGDVAEMVSDDIKVTKGDDVWDALQKLAETPCQRLLVMHDGQLDGVVTQDSIFRLVRMKMQLGK